MPLTKRDFARNISALSLFIILQCHGYVLSSEEPHLSTEDNLAPEYVLAIHKEGLEQALQFAKRLAITLIPTGQDYSDHCDFRIITADHLIPEFDPNKSCDLLRDVRLALRYLADVSDNATVGDATFVNVDQAIEEYREALKTSGEYHDKFGRTFDHLPR